jgi:large subunit ribosomal protein L10
VAARPEKVAVVDRVSEQLSGAAATLLTDYRGLSVGELAELRTELRKVDATYEVVKNTLTRLAARQAGMEGLDEMLVGPTAIVFCGEDPVGPAKALKAFKKDHDALVIKGGYLDGAVLEAEEAIQLAELASREDLLSTLAGLMYNSLAGFARLLQTPLTDAARLQQALVDDGGVEAKGFSPEGAAPAAPVEPEAAPSEPEAAPAEEPVAEEAPAEESATETDPDTSVVDEAVEAASDAAATTAEVVGDAVDTASDAVAETAETVVETVTDAAEAVVDAVTDDSESTESSDDSED